jgi:uncharacterized protein (DUF427 family)
MEGHGINLRDEDRLVEVTLDGEPLAVSKHSIVLEETGLPPRHYFPQDDVRMDRLVATLTETVCPFKGSASYWSATLGDETHRDLAWSYEVPIDGVERIAGYVCFYDERVDVAIDGEPNERPTTPWSKTE